MSTQMCPARGQIEKIGIAQMRCGISRRDTPRHMRFMQRFLMPCAKTQRW